MGEYVQQTSALGGPAYFKMARPASLGGSGRGTPRLGCTNSSAGSSRARSSVTKLTAALHCPSGLRGTSMPACSMQCHRAVLHQHRASQMAPRNPSAKAHSLELELG